MPSDHTFGPFNSNRNPNTNLDALRLDATYIVYVVPSLRQFRRNQSPNRHIA